MSLGPIATIPNALSLLRLIGIPVYLWLILVAHADLWAFVLLIIAGLTDFLDGWLARRLGQQSRLGEILDPLADRLYIASTIIALALRSIIPWWIVLALVLREVMLLALVPLLRRHGQVTLPVTFVGKTATFALLWGFPLLLLSTAEDPWGELCQVLGWTFLLWGTALYWWAGIRYVQAAKALSTRSTEHRSS